MNKQEIISKLKEIAKELKVDFDNYKVLEKYQERYGGFKGEIADEIFSIYEKNPEGFVYGVRLNENGKVIHIKRTKDSDYEAI